MRHDAAIHRHNLNQPQSLRGFADSGRLQCEAAENGRECAE
jgi:hypothetical protein